MKGKNLSRGLSRILSVLLSFVLIFGALPLNVQAEPGTSYTYQQVSSLTDGGIYVICYKSGSTYYAMNNTITSGYAGATSSGITVSGDGNWMTSAVDSSIQWTYASSGNTLKNGSNYLVRPSSGGSTNNLQLAANTSGYTANWTYSSNKMYLGSTSHYLSYTSGSGFNASGNYSGSTVYLFQRVSKTVSSIAIKTHPTKITYVAGVESFDPTNMVITATYNDATTEDISSGYTYSPTGTLPATTTSVTVTYGGKSAPQAVTMNAAIPSITTQPADTSAYVGDTVNLTVAATVADGGTRSYQWYSNTSNSNTGGSIISGATGTNYTVPTTTAGPYYYYCVVTNTDNAVNGTKVVNTNSNAATVTVNANPQSPNISVQPSGFSEYVGDTTNLSVTANSTDGGTLSYQWYNNGSNSSTYSGSAISGATGSSYQPSSTSAGTVYYYCAVSNMNVAPKKATVNSSIAGVTVTAVAVDNIVISTPPSKVTYDEGDTFNPSGMIVTAYYNNGTHADVTGYTFAPTGTLTPSVHTITITYNGKTATQDITVNALVLDHITITTHPTKTSYIEGQLFDTTGMVVTAYFTNGSHAAITTYTWSPNTNLATTDTQVTVSYNGAQDFQPISVSAKSLDHIAISAPPTKTTYVIGQSFSTIGMAVTAYYNNGFNEPVTGYTISPSGALSLSNTKVTVSYTFSGVTRTVDQNITVVAQALDHIVITAPPAKTAYVAGQVFDPTSMVVTAYFNDDSSMVVTGYSYLPTGALATTDTKVTVSYTSGSVTKTAEQLITVAALTNAATPTIDPNTPVDWLAVDVGATASLSVTASVNKGTLTYQWNSDTTGLNSGGVPVGSPSSDPTLTLNTTAAGTTYYYCVVTNTDTTATGLQTATATSRVAQVIVRRNAQTPIIDETSPADMSVYQGSVSSISVSAYVDAGTLTYQWYSNTANSNSGGTAIGSPSSSETLTLNTSTIGPMYYYCVVTNTDTDATGLQTATATSRAARVDISAFKKGTVLFTFDDGWADQYTQAYPILKTYGFKGTAYVNSDFIDAHEDGIMSLSQVVDLYTNGGWDIGDHTTNHDDVGNLTDQTHMAELKTIYSNCEAWLQAKGMTRAEYHVAYPSGLYSQDLIMLLKNLGFKSGRATMFGQQYGIQYQDDYFKLPVYSVGDDDDVAACKQGILDAASGGSTIIFMIHKVEKDSGDLVTTIDQLTDLAKAVKTQVDAGKIQVMTISQWYTAQNKVGAGQAPPAPSVTNDDVANTVSGMNIVMEYKLDGAASYTAYDPTAFASLNLTGNHTLAVRYAASGVDPAGPDTVLTFTKTLSSITITTPPSKTAYSEGTTFDATGMVVTAHYDDSTSEAVTGYAIAPSGALATTDTKVTVSYTNAGITKTIDQPITVSAKKLTSIAITTEPIKKTYVEGTLFDPTGMVVTAYYDNGTNGAVTGYTTSPTGELATTDTNITVSYTYAGVTKTVDQPIAVNLKSLSSIAITTPPTKTIYIEGNNFDSSGMVVTAYYDNGKHADVTGYTLIPSGALGTADTKITVSYTYASVTKTADQPITVNPKSLDHIAITTEPAQKVYIEGNTFNSTGMVVTAYYDNGTHEAVLGYSVTPSGALATTDTKVTVSYTFGSVTKTVDESITVHSKSLTRIEITTPPSKLTYVEGNTFSTAGMVVTAYYDNDTSAVVTGYTFAPSGALSAADVKVTISYTYVGVTRTVDQPITVLSASLDHIAITTPPTKTTYIEGNTFDPTGMVVTAYYNNGTSVAVTGYTITPSGELAVTDTKVTVSYSAKTVDQPITVNAKKLSSIAVTAEPAKKAYIEGNIFDPSGMVVTAYYDNGKSEAVTGYTIAPSGALATTDTKVTVSYTFAGVTKTVDQAITVSAKKLTSIAITTEPTKKNYVEGTLFDSTGMVVTAYYDNGTSGAVTGYTIAPSGELATTDVKVTVSYTFAGITKTADQTIIVSGKVLASIAITTPPTKTTYIEGNAFDPTGMVVTAYYNNGKSEAVTGYIITPSGALATTNTKVTVSYDYKGVLMTADQPITVALKSLDHIAITNEPAQKVYIEGNNFNSTGMVVTAYYDNGTNEAVIGYSVTPSGALATTDTKVTVSYTYRSLTKTADQPITVHAKSLARIEITTPPSKLTYVEGNTFSTAGMVVTAYYDNDTSAVVTGYSFAPSGALSAADVKVTISYTYVGVTKTVDQPITVLLASLDHIAITTPPTKTTYIEGNTFDPTGMVVTAYYNNGTSVAVTGYSITPSGELAMTDTKVTVSYSAKTADQPITVNAKKLSSIAVTAEPAKKAYIEGNIFDPSGMVVTAYYDNGKSEAVTGYTMAPSGALATTDTKITVSYTFAGVTKTVDQAITVSAKKLTNIAITTEPTKKNYVEGTLFDPTGMVVTAYYDNGTSGAVTGYTTAPSGELATTDVKVAVSYTFAGITKSADQSITVSAKKLTNIAVTTPPSKTQYIEGQTFDAAGMVVTAYYDNGKSEAVTVYTIAPSGALATTDTKVTVSYTFAGVTKTADQAITVALKSLNHISITTEPTKKAYIEGNAFDPTGMVVTAYFDNGTFTAVSGYSITPSGALATTDTKVTVNYGGKTVDQAITVAAKSLDHIAITIVPNKVHYVEGQAFVATGMEVTAYYDNGTSGAVTGYSIAPSGALATTDTKVTVSYTYEGVTKTADQAITVIAKAIISLDFKTKPTKTEYMEGQTFDPTGMVLIATYNDGSTKEVQPGDCTYSINRPLLATDTSIDIIYDSMHVTQDIKVYTSAQLKDITATFGALSPKFDPAIKSYTVLLDEHIGGTTITPVLADASSKLYINGSRVLSKTVTLATAGKTIVTIKVQPKIGKAVTYTVTVKRAPSTNTSLAYIKASKGSITEVDATNYTVNLSNTQTSTTFSFKLADKTAKYTMTLDGKKTTSKTVSIKPGTTRILVITVTPQAGSAYAVKYTITIIRAISHNDDLAVLKTSKGTLAPVFDQTLTAYSIDLASNYSSTKLTIKLADSTAKYSITINGKKSSSTISLARGAAKAVTITVTSQAGDVKIYTVTIARAS